MLNLSRAFNVVFKFDIKGRLERILWILGKGIHLFVYIIMCIYI